MILKRRRYTLIHYLFGALPARLGDEMSSQALLLLGFAAAQSAALGSTLLASLTFSAALGGPLLGALLDRSPSPGRLLALAIAAYAAGLTLIALSLGHVPLAVTLAIALGAGFLMPAISGGWSSQLKSFTPPDQLTRASAIDATTFNIAGLAGPALAGLIAAVCGAHWAVAALVVLLLAALPMAWRLPKREGHNTVHPTSFWRDVGDGFTVIVANKKLFRITLTSVISYLGIGMLWVACPLIGQNVFGNAGYGGLLMSVLSVGALAATLAYARWPGSRSPDFVALVTTIILAAAMLALACANTIFVAVAAMLIAGLADGPQLAAIFAVRHREAPAHSRSQVFTTGASLKITAAAIGAIFAGQLAATSVNLVLIVACGVQVVAAISFMVMTQRYKNKVLTMNSDRTSSPCPGRVVRSCPRADVSSV